MKKVALMLLGAICSATKAALPYTRSMDATANDLPRINSEARVTAKTMRTAIAMVNMVSTSKCRQFTHRFVRLGAKLTRGGRIRPGEMRSYASCNLAHRNNYCARRTEIHSTRAGPTGIHYGRDELAVAAFWRR